jgi:chemotaxis protein MotB
MRKARRKTEFNESSHNFWPSFADVMSALVLVLFFLMLLTFIQNILTGDSLKTVRLELSDTELKLSQASVDLENAMYEIDLAEAELLKLQEEINSAISIIDEKEKALVLSQILIDEQNKTISLTNASLEEIRIQMQGIALLRMDILKEVQVALQQSLSESVTTQDTTVDIGENANIIIGGNFLFEYNSANINDNAKPVLTQLAKAFYDVLKLSDTKEKIDSIIIAGHTDNIGNNLYNWELSTLRAQAVVNYLFEINPKLESEYGSYFSAAGFGEHRPIVDNITDENRAMNRRIEISIAVKDSAITDLINSYLENDELTVTRSTTP